MEAHRVWTLNGRPRVGFVNDNRLLCKARYKKALRLARSNFEQTISNKLIKNLLQGDSKPFWSKWNSLFGAKAVHSVCVGRNDDPHIIA